MFSVKDRLRTLFKAAGHEEGAVLDFKDDSDLAQLRQMNADMLSVLTRPGGLVAAALYLADHGVHRAEGAVLRESWQEKDRRRDGLLVACEYRSEADEKRDVLLLEVWDRGVPVMIYRRVVCDGVSSHEGSVYMGFSNWPRRMRNLARQMVEGQSPQTSGDPRDALRQHQKDQALSGASVPDLAQK